MAVIVQCGQCTEAYSAIDIKEVVLVLVIQTSCPSLLNMSAFLENWKNYMVSHFMSPLHFQELDEDSLKVLLKKWHNICACHFMQRASFLINFSPLFRKKKRMLAYPIYIPWFLSVFILFQLKLFVCYIQRSLFKIHSFLRAGSVEGESQGLKQIGT